MGAPDITTKERILDAAEDLFAAKGFDGTKVQEIASSAGVNKAMLYYYFKDKDDLLFAVIERIIGGIRDAIPRYFAAEGDSARNFEEFLDFYIEYLADNRSFVKLMAWELLSGKHVQTIANNYVLPMFSLLRDNITDAMHKKEIREVSPEHVLFSVIGMNVFYIVAVPLISIVLGKDPLSAGEIAERKRVVRDLVMNGLIPRDCL